MIAAARASFPDHEFLEADIATWQPDAPVDIVFSNAALHWLDDHEALFARLVDGLSATGWLAVQMPDNFRAPTHTAIADTIAAGAWRERLAPLVRPAPVHPPDRYIAWLTPRCTDIDIWETTYWHRMAGPQAIVTWIRGAALVPFLSCLQEAEAMAFLTAYEQRIARAYPRADDGSTWLPFRRMFIVARRRA